MPEADGPSASAQEWLEPLRAACERIGVEVAAMAPAERARRLGRGAGGDRTMVVDRLAEDIVVAALSALGRPLTIISEELGEREIGGGGPPLVIVDPIDGSLNASRDLPAFSTSIAVAEGHSMGDVVLGLVRDHGTGEEHVGERGRGAWRDGRRLEGPGPPAGPGLEILLVEGASPRRVGPLARALEGRVGRLRALGSLALSLCQVASGRGDAMVGMGRARSVDVAAAQLIATEAGVVVGLPQPVDRAGMPLDLSARRRVVGARDPATAGLLAGLAEARR